MTGLASAWPALANVVPVIAGAVNDQVTFLTGSNTGISSVLNSAKP
jgi:hypothetical protein